MKKKFLVLAIALLSTGLFNSQDADAVVAGWNYAWLYTGHGSEYSQRTNTVWYFDKYTCLAGSGESCLIPNSSKKKYTGYSSF